MVASLTFIPVMISFAYNKAISDPDKPFKKRENRVFSFMEDVYGKVVGGLLRFSKLTVILGFTIVLFLLSFSTRLGTEFLPELDEGSIFLRGNFPVGITIQENAKYAPKIRSIISKYQQVENVITKTGRNDDGMVPFPANRIMILISMNDFQLLTGSYFK